MPDREAASASTDKFVLSDFLPYRIVVLGHAISRNLAAAYEDEDLTIPEWRVLAVVAQASAMAARDVAALTPMDKMAVSRAVASLEQKGHVIRRTSEADKRVQTLALSREGRQIFDRVAALAGAYQEKILAPLRPEERKAFLSALATLEASAGAVQAVSA